MNTTGAKDEDFLRKATEAAIRIGLVSVLVLMCVWIVMPFMKPVVWGIILAVAIHPAYVAISKGLGGRGKIAATLIVLIALALLLVPAGMFLGSVTEHLVGLSKGLSEGTWTLPKPAESVNDWPVVGPKVHAAWSKTVADTPAYLKQHASHFGAIGKWLLAAAADLALGVLAFAFSLVVMGVLLATAERGTRAAEALGKRVAGARGIELVRLSAATIRSVAVGVVGVAVIQAFLAGIGFVAAGVPAAGVLTLVVLIFAIAQLPAIVVMLPVVLYVFSSGDSTTGAILFAVWSGLVGLSDNILKPLLLGRGVEVPMLVILIGALGGMVTWGILGLFIGAVVLAVAHQIYTAWGSEGEAVPKV